MSLGLFMWEILTVLTKFRDLCCKSTILATIDWYCLHKFKTELKYLSLIRFIELKYSCSTMIIYNEVCLLLPKFLTAINT